MLFRSNSLRLTPDTADLGARGERGVAVKVNGQDDVGALLCPARMAVAVMCKAPAGGQPGRETQPGFALKYSGNWSAGRTRVSGVHIPDNVFTIGNYIVMLQNVQF